LQLQLFFSGGNCAKNFAAIFILSSRVETSNTFKPSFLILKMYFFISPDLNLVPMCAPLFRYVSESTNVFSIAAGEQFLHTWI